MIVTFCYLLTTSLSLYAPTANATATGNPPGNLAYQATVTGSTYDSSGQNTGGWWGGAGFSLQNITNGTLNSDLWVAPHANDTKAPGDEASVYLLIDLGTEQMMNTIKIWNYYYEHPAVGKRMYHNQIVQLSSDGDNWTNVFNQDTNNVAHQDPSDSNQSFANGTLENGTISGVAAGNDEEYWEDTNGGGNQIDFEPITARYIRWWSGGHTGTISHNNLPQMVQLQAYNMNTVTYDYNDGVTPATTVKLSNNTILPKPTDPVPVELGQVFDGWTVDVAGGTVWNFSQPVIGDLKLVANWKTVSTYTVNFSYNDDEDPIAVTVTEGNKVTPPEGLTSEGMVLVGWTLNGVPFNFSTPITGNISLSAIWVPVPTPDAIVIPAGALNIVLGSSGQVTKLIDTHDGTDYVTKSPDDKASYLMSLIVNYTPQYPTAVHYAEEDGTLTFEFASVQGEATVNIEQKGNYSSFTLTDLSLPTGWSAQAVLWGPIKVGINTGGQVAGVAYNDKFGIGIHSLNTKTIGGWPAEYNNLSYPSQLPLINGYPSPLNTRGFNNSSVSFNTWGSVLQSYTWDYTKPTERNVHPWNATQKRTVPALTGDYADVASMIGSSIALYGTRTPNILNVLSNIEVKEGLPHPTINGEWQKTSIETAQDFLVYTDNMYNNIVNDSQMANDAGINYIYGQYGASGPWHTDGGLQFNGNFGGSDAAAKQMVDIAASYGINVGVHTLSNEISTWDSTYITPNAHNGLASAGIAQLTRPMTASDTTLYIDNGKEFTQDAMNVAGSNSILIGKEIIAYGGITQVSEHEWQLTGVLRGHQSTTRSAHEVGTDAKLLFFYYDRYIGDIYANNQMADRMSEIFNDVGIHAMSYDAFEATKMTTYGPIQFSEFPTEIYNRIHAAGNSDGFIKEASDMGSNVWNVISRISWGESHTPINLMYNYLEFYGLNFYPAMIGWTYTYGGHGAGNEPELLMNLAMKAGWNAGTGWYVDANTFRNLPYMAGQIKIWNNAINHGAFVVGGEYTSAVQEEMRKSWSNGKIWRLTEVIPNKEWSLQQVTKDNNFTAIGNPITLHATNNIHVVQPTNGDIATSTSLSYSRAHNGDTVTIYTQAYSGHQLDEASLSVKGADHTEYPITAIGEGTYTFQMPSQDVTIAATTSESNLYKVNLSLNNTTIKPNEPIVATIEGVLSNGGIADLSRATVEYQFSDNRLSVVEGSNTIIVNNDIQNGFRATIAVKVTLDGVTITSRKLPINVVIGNNIATQSTVTVSSSFNDSRFVASNAIDGNRTTAWASDGSLGDPWIQLNFDQEVSIDKINLVERENSPADWFTDAKLEWEGGSRELSGLKSSGDNIVGFDQPITTSWLKLSVKKIAYNPGLMEFEVYEAQEPSVKEIVDYKSVAVDTNIGVIPSLPATVEAVYNDGSTGLVDVVWGEITADMVSQEGVFTVNGTVEGTTLTAKAVYRVINNQPPVTTDNAPIGWVNQDTTVILSASDSGSGVANTYYIVNDDVKQTGNSVVLSEEGVHKIVYWSVNNAGNVEQEHMVTVSIDKTVPETSAALTPSEPDGVAGWYVSPVTVSLDGNDQLSGVSGTEYSLDGGITWQSYTSPLIFDQDSKYAVSYRSTDNAGNIETVKTFSFNLDREAPQISVSLPEEGIIYENSGDFTPQFALIDTLSGVDDNKTSMTLNGDSYQAGISIPLYTLPLGLHTLVISSSDLAGNQGSRTVQFQTVASIDSLKALVTLFADSTEIDNAGIANSLQAKLNNNNLNSFVNQVQAQSGKHISSEAANYLLRDAAYVLSISN